MEKVGLNDTEVIKQDSRNALDKIPFFFQSWNILERKNMKLTECLKLHYKEMQTDLIASD